jgi:anti-sigma factor RsiW
MPPSITCAQVEREDLDSRYLRGELDPATAEAFEAHYFGCDTCWRLVQQGNQVRAARGETGRSGSLAKAVLITSVAAALVAAVAIGLLRESSSNQPTPPDTMRSGSLGLAPPVPNSDGVRVSVVWRSFAAATSYRVRLYRSDGTLVLEREITDTGLSISRDSIGDSAGLIWQVRALDRSGAEVARFPLIPVQR